MTWVSWGKYAKKNGNFSICKVSINGKWIYELWKINPQEFLSRHESFEIAKVKYEHINQSL